MIHAMMASCRECTAQVSSEARACPHCGAPAPTGGAPPNKIEDDLASIRADVKALRWWLVTLPLICFALILAYVLFQSIVMSSK
ncbi:MAG TPA: hypothetical protein VJU16_07390 [Planctomycetota bacterium]|nr:hypothetical protein [Planctomycetota bacterium]